MTVFVGVEYAQPGDGTAYPYTFSLDLPSGTKNGDMLMVNWWTVNTGVFTPSPSIVFEDSSGWSSDILSNTARVGITCVQTKFYEVDVDPTSFSITIDAQDTRAYTPTVVLSAWRGATSPAGLAAVADDFDQSADYDPVLSLAASANGHAPRLLIMGSHCASFDDTMTYSTETLPSEWTKVWELDYQGISNSENSIFLAYEVWPSTADYPAREVTWVTDTGTNGAWAELFRIGDTYDVADAGEPSLDLRLLKIQLTDLPYMLHTRMLDDDKSLA